MLKKNILECIGDTPLVELKNIKEKFGLTFNIFAKLERSNPSGSVKDRAALFIIKEGIKKGLINEDTVIIEATSGNTGISLAMICAILQLKCIIAMPESASIERRKMMAAYGAEVVLTDKSLGMKGAVDKANELKSIYKNSFIADQFNNEANKLAHIKMTAHEILDDLENKVDVFIAGFGTSGTLIGTSTVLKQELPKVEVIGVEPLSSPLIIKKEAGPHKIQGIGANFVPTLYDAKLVDRVIDIKDEDSYEGARLLAKIEGIFAGISSGASLMAAISLDKDIYKDKNVVIVLPDNGERYLSVDGLFN